jgi:hypothetical protein
VQAGPAHLQQLVEVVVQGWGCRSGGRACVGAVARAGLACVQARMVTIADLGVQGATELLLAADSTLRAPSAYAMVSARVLSGAMTRQRELSRGLQHGFGTLLPSTTRLASDAWTQGLLDKNIMFDTKGALADVGIERAGPRSRVVAEHGGAKLQMWLAGWFLLSR